MKNLKSWFSLALFATGLLGIEAHALTINGPLGGAQFESLAGTPTLAGRTVGRVYWDTTIPGPAICDGAACAPLVTGAGVITALGYTPEDVANKSTSTSLGASNTLYPSQNAVKSYVDTTAVPVTRTVSTTAPLAGGGALSGNLTLSLPAATSGQNGYLTSSDWTTFNGKQAAGSYITALTSDVTASGPGSSAATVNSVGGSSASAVNTATGVVNGAESGNKVFASPVNGSSGTPLWRVLSGADLPNPSSSTLGGVQSAAAQSTKWINSISTSGVPALSQPAFTDISGTATVSQGGTGAATFTLNNVLLGNGTSAFQVVAPSTSGNVLTSNGTTWASTTPASAPSAFYEASNASVTATVATNALTIALKDGSGSDPSAGSPAKIGFRSSTATSGAYNQRSVTGALSVVVPASTTLGTLSGIPAYLYIYALDNAGTVELAVSLKYFTDLSIQSSSAISGGSSATTLYSTTARTGVPTRLLGRISISEVTAGTWASAPTEVSLGAIRNPYINVVKFTSGSGTYTPSAGLSYIIIKMAGAGGGGSGGGTTSGTVATSNGGDTTFSIHSGAAILTAAGGVHGGTNQGGLPGTGGAATVGSPAVDMGSFPGGAGAPGVFNSGTSYNFANAGGQGGNGAFGGGGRGGNAGTDAQAGATNTGAGGGGGAGTAGTAASSGNGGGAGATVLAKIDGSNLAASYDYSIGTAGPAGTNGTSGTAGGTGSAGGMWIYEIPQ